MTIGGTAQCVYWIFAVLVSLYHGYRGFRFQLFLTNQSNLNAVEPNSTAVQTDGNTNPERRLRWSRADTIFVRCFQGALFFFVCSMAGFLALVVALYLWNSATPHKAIDAGISILIVTSFLIGLIGAGGELGPLIQAGKLPWIK